MEGIRDLREYFRVLKKHLDCPKSRQAQFLGETEKMIADFRQGNLDTDEADVIEFLGNPRELAAVFLENIDPDRLRQYRNRKMWLRRGCTALFAAVFCLITVWWAYLKFHPREIEVTETIIIYPEVDI